MTTSEDIARGLHAAGQLAYAKAGRRIQIPRAKMLLPATGIAVNPVSCIYVPLLWSNLSESLQAGLHLSFCALLSTFLYKSTFYIM
jgi:hypothetical protein